MFTNCFNASKINPFYLIVMLQSEILIAIKFGQFNIN